MTVPPRRRGDLTPRPPLHRWRGGALVALGLLVSACVVDTGVPSDARLVCAVDADCPGGWTCTDDLCRPAGWAPDTAEPDAVAVDRTGDAPGADDAAPELSRWDDRLTVCAALYDKIKACPAEVKATLGQEVWDLVGDDRDAFASTTCARDLLADATDHDLDTYLAEAALLGPATCSFFVSVLCDLFPAHAGYTTNCP